MHAVLIPTERRDAIEAMMREFLDRMEPYVKAFPGQWRGWHHMMPGR